MVFMLSAFLIAGFNIVDHRAFAQNVDTTIKPLPDFIRERPEAPLPETAPQDILDPQTPITAPVDTSKPLGADMSDIPDEYIIEASKFGDECRNNDKLNKHFDCRCMAVKYLDARIEYGPSAGVSVIRNKLGYDCKDATGIAGELYQACLLDIENAPTHLDPEEYCSCYANTFAKYFEEWPGRITINLKVSLMSRAKLTCRDPAGARKIYGAGPLTR